MGERRLRGGKPDNGASDLAPALLHSSRTASQLGISRLLLTTHSSLERDTGGAAEPVASRVIGRREEARQDPLVPVQGETLPGGLAASPSLSSGISLVVLPQLHGSLSARCLHVAHPNDAAVSLFLLFHPTEVLHPHRPPACDPVLAAAPRPAARTACSYVVPLVVACHLG